MTRRTSSLLAFLALALVHGSACKRKEEVRDRSAVNASKMDAPNCVDPRAEDILAGTAFTDCHGLTVVGTMALSPPTLAPEDLLAGVVVGDVIGTLPALPPNPCSADLRTDCMTSTNWPAARLANLVPANIRRGATMADIAGSQRPMRLCRNGRGITSVGGNVRNPWDGAAQGLGRVTVAAGSTTVDGVWTYFVRSMAVGDEIAIGSETARVSALDGNERLTVERPFARAATNAVYKVRWAQGDLTVDDRQNDAALYYDGTERTNCNESNFTDISAEAGARPDPTLEPEWLASFEDTLTGLRFTNAMTEPNWLSATARCGALTNGTGSGWRLPTLKELLQLHIDGIAYLPKRFSQFGSPSVTANFFHSSTTEAYATEGRAATILNLADAAVRITWKGENRDATFFICVSP